MYPIVNAFWELLKGNIIYEDKTIPIVKRLKSKDKTPCITLDIASDMQINRDYRTDKTQRIVLEHSAEIWVNIWCDTEEERHTILSQIRLLFFKALGNHYTTCSHYNDGTCNFLDRECEALTVMNGRSNAHIQKEMITLVGSKNIISSKDHSDYQVFLKWMNWMLQNQF